MKSIFFIIARLSDAVSHWAWSKYQKNTQSNKINSSEVSQFTQDIWTSNHHIVVDQPINIGGNNKGATPSELLQAALASCTVITLRMYCKKKAITLEHLSVDIVKSQIMQLHETTQKPITTTLYNITLNIKGDVSDKDKKRMKMIAARCPVHLALKNTPQFKIDIS